MDFSCLNFSRSSLNIFKVQLFDNIIFNGLNSQSISSNIADQGIFSKGLNSSLSTRHNQGEWLTIFSKQTTNISKYEFLAMHLVSFSISMREIKLFLASSSCGSS